MVEVTKLWSSWFLCCVLWWVSCNVLEESVDCTFSVTESYTGECFNRTLKTIMSSTFTWQLVLQLLCKCVGFLVSDILKVYAQMDSVLHYHCHESHCDMISDTVLERLGARGGAVGWGTALQVRRSWVIGIFNWHNPSGCTMTLGLTQPLTEMSTRNISWEVKAAGA
jgi:hypothetical protein